MKRPLCTATTLAGNPCRQYVMEGSTMCSAHTPGTGVGRPTKLNDKTAEAIVGVLRAGGYPQVAARAAGIHPEVLATWLRRGDPAGTEPRDAPYRRLRVRVEQAKAEGEQRNVALIARAAGTNWQAAAWLLERQYPERWARPSQREKDEGPPTATDAFAEVDELAQRRAR